MTTNTENVITRWERRRKEAARDEAGAVLILALVFLVAVSGMVLALAGSTSNNLLNSVHFNATRTVDNAASNAIQVAIQSIRYDPLLETVGVAQTLNASPPSYCWGSSPSSFSSIDVWCSTVWAPSSANSRIVTFSACPTSVTTDPTTCALHPLLQEVVTFDDYPAGDIAPNNAQCSPQTSCGQGGMKVESLIWSPVVPTVTAISPSSGPITGQTALAITGSGFVNNATTVSFIDTNPTDNVILQATNISVTSATAITATSPAITTGATYYVAVTTPGGTSAHLMANNFTYATVTPNVSNISPNTGQVQRGTLVTISGSGFVTGTNRAPPFVTFIPQGGGSPFLATAVSVVGATTITAISPNTAPAGTYIVTVTTTNGTSASGPVFTNS